MKQLKVNKKCNGCGVCLVSCEYLCENEDGNAEVVRGKVIAEKDIEKIEELVRRCPVKALQIMDVDVDDKRTIKDIVNEFKADVENFKLNRVSLKDVKILDPDIYLDTPISYGEGDFIYSSKSEARSAASNEFNKLCYSQNAYRLLLKKYFVDYKMKVLRPYYTCENRVESIYFLYNQKIRELLEDTYVEIISKEEGKRKIPETWKEFSVYPNENDYNIKGLMEFERYSTQSGIIDAWNQLPYTSASDYLECVEYYDIEDGGELEGSIFGFLTRKVEWCYSCLNDAISKYVEDLARAVNMQDEEIEETAKGHIDNVLEELEANMKKELEKKLKELIEYTGCKDLSKGKSSSSKSAKRWKWEKEVKKFIKANRNEDESEEEDDEEEKPVNIREIMSRAFENVSREQQERKNR